MRRLTGDVKENVAVGTVEKTQPTSPSDRSRLPAADQPNARIARIVDLPIARDVIERQDGGWRTMLLAQTR
jgi:hypothetical protein